jgi:gliding motility-associated-like protein
MIKILFRCLFLLLLNLHVEAQIVCTNPGQTPATAFPVCNFNPLHQSKVPGCYNRGFYVPGCTTQSSSYGDNNPIYYQFTCFKTGTFGFMLTPNNPTDDFDWQLFDMTGKDPDDIYTSKSIAVAGNWSGNLGPTGTSAAGVSFIQCRSDPFYVQTNTFAAMPVLELQHNYILLVAHSDSLQGGYTITFNGGTADITDKVLPTIISGNTGCNNTRMILKLNKKIKCSSIAADGSDFILSASNASIVSATGLHCNNQIDNDSIIINFNQSLQPGNYILTTRNGTDGNTLLDLCNNAINTGNQLQFTVTGSASIDSLAAIGCSTDKLILFFKNNIQCSSLAANGSDFFITGSSLVNIISATGICNRNNFANSIELKLSEPITKSGNFSINLQKGNDGNTILDECGFAIPVGSNILFNTKDTVNAEFIYSIREGCDKDTVSFIHDGKNGVNKWQWAYNSSFSNLQNPTTIYTSGGSKLIQLIVSNGVCNDTANQLILLNEKLKVEFTGPVQICNQEPVQFINNSENTTSWFWNFGNGITSQLQNPPVQNYSATSIEKNYKVELTAGNSNCNITTSHILKVVPSCNIEMPNAFTPNNDGLNDLLYPLNTSHTNEIDFKVYNRYGQIVFQSNHGNLKWDGKYKSFEQPEGTYIWTLQFIISTTGKKTTQKGKVLLIR